MSLHKSACDIFPLPQPEFKAKAQKFSAIFIPFSHIILGGRMNRGGGYGVGSKRRRMGVLGLGPPDDGRRGLFLSQQCSPLDGAGGDAVHPPPAAAPEVAATGAGGDAEDGQQGDEETASKLTASDIDKIAKNVSQ